jgi:uncharacterized membrane protein YgcG
MEGPGTSGNPNTRVWVYGFDAWSSFRDGAIDIKGEGSFRQGDYAAVLLVFEPGLLKPVDQKKENLDDLIRRNMVGSIWESDYLSDSSGSGSESSGLGSIYGKPVSEDSRYIGPYNQRRTSSVAHILVTVLMLGFMTVIIPVTLGIGVFLLAGRSRGNRTDAVYKSRNQVSYKNVDYYRDLPFRGDIYATYSRLLAISEIKASNIIGTILLTWILERQVEIVAGVSGILTKKEETNLRMNPPNPHMPDLEHRLYRMMVAAAGKDSILQKKEFEKFARRHYDQVGGWLSSCEETGERKLLNWGALTKTTAKSFFGLLTRYVLEETPTGQDMTRQALGFKKYLNDFTIINEREAREVELWDHYLIFAQLFGIAQRVAEQFRHLYPEYFTQGKFRDLGPVDFTEALAVSNSFSGSMYSGYVSGSSASSSDSGSSSSGGGGGSSSSGGGGGGASGGGGFGGR